MWSCWDVSTNELRLSLSLSLKVTCSFADNSTTHGFSFSCADILILLNTWIWVDANNLSLYQMKCSVHEYKFWAMFYMDIEIQLYCPNLRVWLLIKNIGSSIFLLQFQETHLLSRFFFIVCNTSVKEL